MFGFFRRKRRGLPRDPMFQSFPYDPDAPRLNGITQAAIWLQQQSVTDQAAVLTLLEDSLRAQVRQEWASMPPVTSLPEATVATARQTMARALSAAGQKADPKTGVVTDAQGREIAVGPFFEPRFPLDIHDDRNRVAVNLAFQEMRDRTWIRDGHLNPVRLAANREGRLMLEVEVGEGYLGIPDDTTWTDLQDVIDWVKQNRPDLLAN